MKKTKKADRPAPKGNKAARRNEMVEKLLSVDDLRQVSGGIISRPPPCCVPCD
jgi:hypothetical protein